jgi:AraC-like DNA-binding protein
VFSIRHLTLHGGDVARLTVVSSPSAFTEVVVATDACMFDHHPSGVVLAKPRDFVFGPMASERAADVALSSVGELRVLSVMLQPGVLPALVGVAARELRDAIVDANELVSARLTRALAAELTTDDGLPRWASIERCLLRAFGDLPLPDPRLRRALSRVSSATLDEVFADAGLSPRHAERMFAHALGLSPKQLQRIARFRTVAGQLAAGARLDAEPLAALAAAAGYADQSHLTREFKDFTGTTPGRYSDKRSSAFYLAASSADGGNLQETSDATR